MQRREKYCDAQSAFFNEVKKIIESIFLPVCYALDMKVLDSGNQLEEIFLSRKFRHPQIWLNPEHSVRKEIFSQNCMSQVKTIIRILKVRYAAW
jgi:hypothetical protein